MQSFVGLPTKPYIGVPYTLPVSVRNSRFSGERKLPPTCAATIWQWAQYGASTVVPNVAGTINLQAQIPGVTLIDQIRSVRIDNLGNSAPVYVQFPDTLYTIVAPPNTVVWERAETAGLQAVVAGEGFTNANVGVTAVYFCNYEVPPFIDYQFPTAQQLWLASSTITRGTSIYNQNFGTPALGDQMASYNDAVTVNGVLENGIWGTPYASGFLYLTAIDMIYSNSNNAAALINVFVESTGSAGVLFERTINSYAVNNLSSLVRLSGLNIKLDATQTWRIRVSGLTVGAVATLSSMFVFTTNPN